MQWRCFGAVGRRVTVITGLAACGHPTPRPPLLPISVTANYLDGALAREAEQHAAAAQAFAHAAIEAPAVFPLVEQARATARAGDAAQGLAFARAGVARFATSAELWIAIGQLSIAAKCQASDVQQAFARARALAPNDERGYLLAAGANANPAQQRKLVRALLQRKPDSLDGNMAYAELLGRTAFENNSTQARAELAALQQALRVALKIEPNQIDARLSLATALFAANQQAQAIIEVRSAFSRSGDDFEIGLLVVRLLVQADRRSDARDTLRMLIDDRPVAALITIATTAMDLGFFDDAQRIITTLEPAEPNRARLLQANLALHRGVPALTQALLAPLFDGPDADAARLLSAEAALRSAEPAQARELLKDASTGDGLALRAEAEAAVGELAQAYATLAAIATLDGEQSNIRQRSRAAQFALAHGDARGAVALLTPIIVQLADAPQLQNLWAFALTEAHQDLSKAAIASSRAMRLAPGDPAVLDTRGWVLLHQGHTRAAVQVLDLAHRLAPARAEITLHLAHALAADGAPRSADALAVEALALPAEARVQAQIHAFRALLAAKQ